jgi:hypothetical protein
MKQLIIIFFFSLSVSYGQSTKQLVPFYKNGKWGFADTSMNIVVLPTYDYVTSFINGYAIIRTTGLFGLIDSSSKIVIPTLYKTGFDLYENYTWIKKDLDWIIIDKKGTEIIPEYKYYSRPFTFNEGLSRVVRNEKYGFVDESGNEIISCIYDSSYYKFEEGFVAVKLGNNWGFINKQGKVVVDFKYNYAYNFQEGRALVADWSKGYGFVDITGKEVIPLQFRRANPFFEGLALVEIKGKIGFIDRNGNILIKPKFLWCNNFKEGFNYVGKNFISKVYNSKGKCVMTSFRYEDISYFCEGLAVVNSRLGKFGYIDTTGKQVISLQFDFAEDFHNGLAVVEINGKNGYINHKGELVIPTIYENAFSFENGIAKVERNGKQFYIDKKGQEYIAW